LTAAGVTDDRMVVEGVRAGSPYPVLVDACDTQCPVAVTAAGLVTGARIVRTGDVRGARRICDVLAAILETR
jgi:hypothetical protein